MVEHRLGHRRQVRVNEPVLHGIPPMANLLQLGAERGRRGDPAPLPLDEGLATGEEGPHLARREGCQQRQTGGGEGRRKADADIGDEGGSAGRPLLDHVEDIRAVKDGEMGVVAGGVDEAVERAAGETDQPFLPLEGRAEFVGSDAQSVAMLLGEMGDVAATGEDGEQVVDR